MDLFKSIDITKKINRPKENLDIHKFLLKTSSNIKKNNLDPGSYELLKTQKTKIDNIHKNIWLNISFLSNPYEYIHPKITKYYKNDRIVSMEKPISRAFYKMWEIMNVFPIFKYEMNGRSILYHTEKPYLDNIKTAHLCEGPGGFIEALIKKRNNNKDDEMHGLTIMCDNENKLFMNTYDNLKIHYGDITNIETIQIFCNVFKEKKAYLITADGGFQDENRENIQEHIHSQLIFSEILTALNIQAQNGRFICKIYDINTKLTAFMIKLLTYFYKDVYIFKPMSSRPINSERYLVCLDFIGISEAILNKLTELKNAWTNIDNSGGLKYKNNQPFVYRIYNDHNFEYDDISSFNFLYTTQQLKYINFALDSVSNLHEIYFLDKIKNFQIEYSTEWCLDNNIPIHSKYQKNNFDNDEHYNQMEPFNTEISNTENIGDYELLISSIDNNNEEILKRYSYSPKINKGRMQLFIYTYLQKKYHLLQYFIKNVRLSNLLYFLNSVQIIDLLKNIDSEKRFKIVLPFTKICILYINNSEKSDLRDYLFQLYPRDIQKNIIKTPMNKLKHFIKFEKLDILKELSKNYNLSIKIMRHTLYYNSSYDFITELHKINHHYVFTEDDLIHTIKFGNFKLFHYICEHSSIKFCSKYILNYAIKYDFPIDIVTKILNMYNNTPNYNIYKLMKRDTNDIEIILDVFNKKGFLHPNMKIYHFINDNYKTPNHLLVLLYKYKVLDWTIQDYNFLKNKMSLEELKELVKLISHHIYDDKL